MEQWSIMSNIINYLQHSRFHSMKHMLDIKAVNKYKHKPSTDNREFKELDFSIKPQKLQEEYMDICEGIQSEIVSSNRFDENSDLSTTYLGRADKESQNKLKQKNHSLYQNMGILRVDCWMAQNVNYYWTQLQVNASCQNHSTCNASHFTLCQNVPQGLKEFK